MFKQTTELNNCVLHYTDKTTVFFVDMAKTSVALRTKSHYQYKAHPLNDQPYMVKYHTPIKQTQLSITMGPTTYGTMWLIHLNSNCTSDDPFIPFPVSNALCIM